MTQVILQNYYPNCKNILNGTTKTCFVTGHSYIVHILQFLRNTLFPNGPECTKPSHIKLPIFDKTNFKFQIIRI